MKKVKKGFNFSTSEVSSIRGNVMSLRNGNVEREQFSDDMVEFMKDHLFETEGIVYDECLEADRFYVSDIVYSSGNQLDSAVYEFLSFIRDEIRENGKDAHSSNFDGFMENWDDLSDSLQDIRSIEKLINT